ncbi:VanZ family protein [Clostridium septicum]|uniref:VanZ family protein n=1 Tax=Clostridium septicum TaxID=1504 RepID=UPI00272E1AA0|nr:VanZ family protein [Clostridium septicum]WLF68946.1 VanZ family protein [Clostridium septicum]
MNIMITAIFAALPFYLLALPIILLNMLLISKKRKLLNIGFELKEKIAILGFILSIIFVLGITIGNNNSASLENVRLGSINIIPLKGMKVQYLFALKGYMYFIINLFGNVLIFIPLGFFLSIYYKDDAKERFKIIITSMIISFFIEFLQLFIGRASDINDIILNTIGAWLGRLIFLYFNIIFQNFFNTINLRCINISNNKGVKRIRILQLFLWIIFLVFNLM